MKGFIENEMNLSFAADPGDGCISFAGFNAEVSAGTTIKRNAAAARIQDEVETIFKIFESGPDNHNAAAVLLKRETGYKLRIGAGNELLAPCKGRQQRKQQKTFFKWHKQIVMAGNLVEYMALVPPNARNFAGANPGIFLPFVL